MTVTTEGIYLVLKMSGSLMERKTFPQEANYKCYCKKAVWLEMSLGIGTRNKPEAQ